MVKDKAIAAIARTKNIPVDKISLDSSFEDLGMDSLDAIELLYELEEEFGVKIPDEVAREVTTVRQVVEKLEQIGSAKPTSTTIPSS